MSSIRRRCFVSYHHRDELEVRNFIARFDHAHNVFIARGIGSGMPGDVIISQDRDYIMRRVREQYMASTTVTIVLIGQSTWARKYVDWEIAATLRNNPTSLRSGLLGISLPSLATPAKIPPRLSDNLGENGYARWWSYPSSLDSLARCIEIAYEARENRGHLAKNDRLLFSYNRNEVSS